ncbi:MAG TPA: hypothetical protein VNZ22_00750, partial [Bacillota bacterium]|nr:hypothetical protein [Bacillota bacterium]
MHSSCSRRKFLTASAVGLSAAAAVPSATLAASTTENSPLAMPRRPLGKTGWMISIVGFGGGSRYLLQEDLAVAERMIHRAVELG